MNIKLLIPFLLLLFIIVTNSRAQFVRVINEHNPGTTLNTTIDNSSNSELSSLGFSDASSLVSLTPGKHSIKVTIGGLSRDTLLDVQTNTAYTFHVMPAVGTLNTFILTRELDKYVDKGAGYLQLVHAGQQLGIVDVELEDSRGSLLPYSNMAYVSARLYYLSPAGETIYRVGPNSKPPVYQGLINNIDGNLTTVVLTGKFSDNSFKASYVVDNDIKAQKPMKELVNYLPMPRLRAVNCVSGASKVDVKIDNSNLIFKNIGFKQASNSLKVAPGSKKIAFVLASTPIDIVSINANLVADSVYTIFSMGLMPNSKAVLGSFPKKTGLGLDESWVRFAHAGSDTSALSAQIIETTGNETSVDILNGEITGYVKLRRGNTSFDLSKISGGSVYRTELDLAPQGVYTIVITGSDNSLELSSLIENDTIEQLPMKPLDKIFLSTDLRIVNMVPNSPLSSLVLDNSSSELGLTKFRFSTLKVRTNVGAHQLSVFVNKALATQIPFTLNADSSYLLLFGGKAKVGEFFQSNVARLSSLMPPSSRSMIRCINMNGEKSSLTVTMKDKNANAVNNSSLASGRATKFYETVSGNVFIEISSGGNLVYKAKTPIQPNLLATFIIGGLFDDLDDSQFGVNLLFESDTTAKSPIPLLVKDNIVSVKLENLIEVSFYPNPSNGFAQVKYTLPSNSKINILIYNALGNKVFTSIEESKNLGENSTNVDLQNLQSGSYNLVVLKDGKIFGKEKFLLVK